MTSRDSELERACDAVGAGLASPGPRTPVWRVQGLCGSGRAYFLWKLACRHARPLLVIREGSAQAEALFEDLRSLFGEDDAMPFLDRRVHLFPAYGLRPFDELSPPPEVVALRIEALFQLQQGRNAIVVAPVEALLQKVPPRRFLAERWKYLAVGEQIDRDRLASELVDWGYRRVGLVEDRGDLAVRGSIVDIYPPGYALPLRVELDGDTIAACRSFDPSSQRSLGPHNELLLLPVREFSVGALREERTLRAVEERAFELELPRNERGRILEALEAGILLPGIEQWLPLLFAEPLESVRSYLPDRAWLCLDGAGAVEAAMETFCEEVEERARRRSMGQEFFVRPESLYLQAREWRTAFFCLPRVEVEPLELLALAGDAQHLSLRCSLTRDVKIERVPGRREVSFQPVAHRVAEWLRQGERVVVVVQGGTQANRLSQLFENYGVRVVPPAPLAQVLQEPRADAVRFALGHLSEGFRLPSEKLVVLGEAHLFGEHRQRRRGPKIEVAQLLKNLAELRANDFVVHIDYGVGRYRGLVHLSVGGTEGDYLHLEYAGGDRLYLPVEQINLLQKYVGSDEKPPVLDRLGSQRWAAAKKKAKEHVLAMAKELLEVYAAREVLERKPYPPPDAYYRQFEAEFPFEETEDQARAIEEVLADLRKSKPMDRLVCGDVGFGKTEVAMRAAFLAVMDGRQVAVLVPTTILAEQHLFTFRKRFANYPVRIEMLSRFCTPAENKSVLEGLASGSVDIVIGTHRLLQKDVNFRQLGLLVIDEEHRFGVKHKERIRQLRKRVDCLTLTATPIPRTLQMALLGIRDLSVIETPPIDRLAVRTYVTRYDETLIREAILREKARGGQVFFVHNRVESIEIRARQLRQLVPECRFAVAHGQMRERELEEVMREFMEQRVDVLVCSAIIESGLDIPTANTLLIDRADHFGLAQLYQLRGRVGRSHERAYAYLMIPGEELITREAQMRLRALQELDDLGGGFRLATSDLEIRGAGNLLGKEQSGQIAAVGFELYEQMLAEAVHELRGQQWKHEVEPEIQLGIPAFLPQSYIPDEHQRLIMYRRLASIRLASELQEIAAELRDRYGPLPPETDSLLQLMKLRRLLKNYRVERVVRQDGRVVFSFDPQAPIDPERVVALVRSGKGRYALPADFQVSMQLEAKDFDGIMAEIEAFLHRLFEERREERLAARSRGVHVA